MSKIRMNTHDGSMFLIGAFFGTLASSIEARGDEELKSLWASVEKHRRTITSSVSSKIVFGTILEILTKIELDDDLKEMLPKFFHVSLLKKTGVAEYFETYQAIIRERFGLECPWYNEEVEIANYVIPKMILN